jgi:ankyrin repeat protein
MPKKSAPANAGFNAPDLWNEALKVLSLDDQLAIGAQKGDKAEILERLLAVTDEKKELCLKKRWKYRKKDGDIIIRDQLEKVTAWIQKFKDVGNAVAQYDPGHISLPWAGVLFLLQISLNDSQTFGEMIEGLEVVAHTLTRYTIMEQLYLCSGPVSSIYDQLRENLIKLYVSILRYLARAKAYFSKSTLRRALKSSVQSAELAVQVHLDLIQKKAKSVDACLDVLKAQSLETTSHTTSRLLRLLTDLETPIIRSSTQISEIHDHLKINERAKILRWLTNVPISLHHRTIGKSFLPNSCDWFLKLQVFVDFRKSSISSVLWLHGIPGSGKTYLVHHVINHLLMDNTRSKSAAPIAYFYCARNPAEPKRASPDDIMQSILKQLASSSPDNPVKSPVVSLFRERLREADMDGTDPVTPTAAECVPVILKLLEKDPATIVIDALDECDPNRRHELFSALERILQESASLVKIFVSSRDAADISDRFSGGPNIYLRAEHNTEDIGRFIDYSLEDALQTKRLLHGNMSDSLKADITTRLKEGAGGMFRWVSLQIDNLCDTQRIKIEEDVRQEVGRLPKTLADSYDVLYQRITGLAPSSQQVAENVLRWLLCAETLLDAEKLTSYVESSTQLDCISISQILDICSFLIVVDDRNIVRFAHLSVREYLENQPKFSLDLCHSVVLERCLTVYSLEDDYQCKVSPHIAERLRPYSMLYWPVHCSKSQAASNTELRESIERFMFDDSRPSISFEDWVSDAWNLSQYSGTSGDDLFQRIGATASTSSSPFFLACCFGMTWILERLLACGYRDWDEKNKRSESGIYLAARWGSVEALSWLLDKTHPSPEDVAEALVGAIEGNDERSTLILLNYGANGYHRTKNGDTVLHLVVRRKDVKTLDRLLNEPCPLRADSFAEALEIAYDDPRGDVFAMMWSRCTELNRNLYLAVFLNLLEYDDHPLVEHMLDYASKDSDLSDIAELDRLGALHWLWYDQDKDSSDVSFCLELDNILVKGTIWQPHSQDELDSTQLFKEIDGAPLIIAACLKDKYLTKLLLPFCRVDEEDHHWTALGIAIALNQVAISSMLLANGADPNKLTAFDIGAEAQQRCSPLVLAALHNRVDIISLLLSYGAKLDDGSMITNPTFAASKMGSVNTLALLRSKGADINVTDQDGKTALHHAVKENTHKSLDYLCQKAGATVNTRSKKGKSPLMVAVKKGCHHCVDQLLACGADVNALDNDGKDAFRYLQDESKGCSIAKKLIEHGARWSSERSAGAYVYPLYDAVCSKDLSLAQLFLGAGMSPDHWTWRYGSPRPLLPALMNHDKDMVQLLIQYGTDPTLDLSRWTDGNAIHLVVAQQDPDMLKLLLAGTKTVDVQDGDGDTPLHIAFRENVSVEIIDMLLSAGALEECRNQQGLTPLDVAVAPREMLIKENPFSDHTVDDLVANLDLLHMADADGDDEEAMGLISMQAALETTADYSTSSVS